MFLLLLFLPCHKSWGSATTATWGSPILFFIISFFLFRGFFHVRSIWGTEGCGLLDVLSSSLFEGKRQ